MQIRTRRLERWLGVVGCLVGIAGLGGRVEGQTVAARNPTPYTLHPTPYPLPPDVRANHWARQAVQEVLQNGIMTAQADKNFHGEAKVTRAQAIIAVAKLAQSLEAGKWVVAPSARVPSKFLTAPLPGDWKKQPLRRYALASVLARLGDYIANGLPRPPAGSKDVDQSTALPQKATLSIPKSHPAYDALDYLTRNRMLWPNAALLKPDDQPVLGAELSQALAQMTVGLTDRLTELGHDANGDSIDVNSPKKKPSGNR